jgi:hypothetical protein
VIDEQIRLRNRCIRLLQFDQAILVAEASKMRTPFAEASEIRKPSDTILKKIFRWILQPILGIFALTIIISIFGAFYAFAFRVFFYLRDGKWSNSLCDLFFDIRIRGGNFINLCEFTPSNIDLINNFVKHTISNYDVSIILMIIGITLTSVPLVLIGTLIIINRIYHR